MRGKHGRRAAVGRLARVGGLALGLVIAVEAPASAQTAIEIDMGYSDVVGTHYTDVGPGWLSIGQEPLVMAYCEQHLGYMQVNYTLTFQGEVLHRVGLHELNTGAVAYDHLQSTFVNGGAYPVRYVTPPTSGEWAPFIEVWVPGAGGWEHAWLYVPVEYSHSACLF